MMDALAEQKVLAQQKLESNQFWHGIEIKAPTNRAFSESHENIEDPSVREKSREEKFIREYNVNFKDCLEYLFYCKKMKTSFHFFSNRLIIKKSECLNNK